MVDGVTAAFDLDFDDIPVREALFCDPLDRWGGAPLRAEAVGRVLAVGGKARLDPERARLVNHPVSHGRNPEGAFPSVRLGAIDPPPRLRSVAPSPQVLFTRLEQGGSPLPLDGVYVHLVDAGTAARGAPFSPGLPPPVRPAQAVVERMESAMPAPLDRLVSRALEWS